MAVTALVFKSALPTLRPAGRAAAVALVQRLYSNAPTEELNVFQKASADARKHVKCVSVQEAKQLYEKKVKFFDVREANEYCDNSVLGSTYCPRGVIDRDIAKYLDSMAEPIVVYCAGGVRSVLACESLQKVGVRHAVSMDGGYEAWKEAGYPLAQLVKKA